MDLRLAFVGFGWLLGWWLLWKVPRLGGDAVATRAEASPTPGAPVGCTVIVPARNEEQALEVLLHSLACQSRRPRQILVIDDQSTDATADVAASFPGVTVVNGEPLPAGWTGKTWACHQGAQLATEEVLVFIDADVDLGAGALEALLAAHARHGGLVSVQPYHHMERAYEQFSALFNIIGFMGVAAASPRRGARSRGAFGPCLVTTQTDYERIGGHTAVRGEIVEDIALAHRFERAGLSVVTFGGRGTISFRMYPEGMAQLVEGWSKNFATGAGSVGVLRTVGIGMWVTSLLLAVQFAIEAATGHSPFGLPVVVGVYLAFAAQLGVMLHQLGSFTWVTALAFPAPLGIFVVVFARSVYLTLFRRRVTWRGRAIPLRRHHRWAREPARRDD